MMQLGLDNPRWSSKVKTGHDHTFGQTSRYVILNCIVKYYRYYVMFYASSKTPYAIRNTQYAIHSSGRWRVLRPPKPVGFAKCAYFLRRYVWR